MPPDIYEFFCEQRAMLEGEYFVTWPRYSRTLRALPSTRGPLDEMRYAYMRRGVLYAPCLPWFMTRKAKQ